MNKSLKLLAAATLIALTTAACQKEKLFDSQTAGEETVTFTVKTDAAATKATADGDGQGAGLNRCLVAVYMKTADPAQPYKLYDTPATTGSGLNYTFTVNLIRKQTYQIVVWADKGETVYDVNEGLTLVTRKTGDVACNSDAYDAFYASTEFVQGTTTSTAITAKRPFAQLNLITKDLNENFQPGAVSVTYSSPQSFNPFDGTVSADMTEVTYKADSPYYNTATVTTATQHTLVMNYLFAAAGDQTILPSVKMTAKLTVDAEIEVANVPVRRNYRTNIIGNLLTEQTDFNIIVDPRWSGETDVEWVSVATVAKANEALQAGKTNVAIESVETDGSVIEIPQTNASIGITLPSNNAKAVTIKYKTSSESGQTPNLNVAAENNTGDLVINAPQSHVTLNGAAYNNVTASTSNTTLVVEEGVTIENLTVNQGAVEIYGTVKNITLAPGCTIKVWAVGDKGTFKTAYDNGAQTIELKNDITDFSSCIEIGRNLNLDGNGFAIHNTATRVVRITQPNLTVNFTDVALISKCTASSDVRCVSFDNIASGANVLFDNCELSASFYCINAIVGPENLNVTLRNATVAAGWAAINCYANNSTFTIENSTLKGLNDKSESSWNDFATIVFDGNGLWNADNIGKNGTGNRLNVVNSTIYASSESSNNQAWLALQYGAQRNIVNVDAATRIIDAAGNDQTGNVNLAPVVGWDNATKTYTSSYDLESEIWLAGQNAFPGFYEQDGVYHINSTYGLQYFSDKVTKYNVRFVGETVLLENDLDMSGIDFTPISNTIASYPSNSFAGTFDGQGHTIANLKASSNEVNYAAAGLFGTLTGTVKNVNLTNVDITSSHYAGGVVGYISSNTGATVQNCTVKGGSITAIPELIGEKYDNGDKVGGVVGYITYGDFISDCAVSDLTIKAYRDLGGIVGCTSGDVDVRKCTVGENVKVVVDNTYNYKNYTQNSEYNAGSIIGRDATGTATTTGSTGTATITYPY